MTDYYSVAAINASAIKAGAISMLKMQDEIERGTEATAAMRRGSLQHLAILEPAKFAALHVEDYDGRTKAGKELLERVGKDNIIKPAEHAELVQAQKMVADHPAVKQLALFWNGVAEVARYWQEGGVDCKCKIDYCHDDYIVEYKTTGNLTNFIRSAENMSYYLQLGWYWRGESVVSGKEKRVFVVAQEQKAPFDVAVFEVPQLMLKTWYFDCLEIVKRYASGDRSGAFPEIMQFERPAYVLGADPVFDNNEVEF